jgi:hypothetical protein
MTPVLQIRRTPDGRIQARRVDGRPLTAQDKEEAKRIATTGQRPTSDPAVLVDGSIVAVLIDSSVLGAPIWFAFADRWKNSQPDGIPIFYASELPTLREKTPEQLRSILNIKRFFGGGQVKA